MSLSLFGRQFNQNPSTKNDSLTHSEMGLLEVNNAVARSSKNILKLFFRKLILRIFMKFSKKMVNF